MIEDDGPPGVDPKEFAASSDGDGMPVGPGSMEEEINKGDEENMEQEDMQVDEEQTPEAPGGQDELLRKAREQEEVNDLGYNFIVLILLPFFSM